MDATPLRGRLFASACAGIFVFGLSLALLGVVFGQPEMRARLGVNLAQQGDIFLFLYLGIFLATLAAGPMIDRFGHRLVLFASSLFATAAMWAFAQADRFLWAALAAGLLGLGGGGLNTATTALVSDLYGEQRGPRLNYLGVFFGFGALFLPLIAASLSATFTVSQLLWMGMALSALCAVAFAVLRFPPPREAGASSLRPLLQMARDPGVLLFGFVLFCQSGNEAVIGGWTTTFLGSRGIDSRMATWVLAGYWAMLMLGRLLAGWLLGRIGKPQLVLASGAGAMAGCAVLLLAPSLLGSAIGALLIGLSFSGIFPTVLAMAGDRYAHSSGTIFGLLFAIALIGGMTFPWATGHIAQALSLRTAMLLPLAGSVFICGTMLALRRPR